MHRTKPFSRGSISSLQAHKRACNCSTPPDSRSLDKLNFAQVSKKTWPMPNIMFCSNQQLGMWWNRFNRATIMSRETDSLSRFTFIYVSCLCSLGAWSCDANPYPVTLIFTHLLSDSSVTTPCSSNSFIISHCCYLSPSSAILFARAAEAPNCEQERHRQREEKERV